MPKKQTLEEFIKKSNIAHNFKYNYDKSIYINKQTKVIVICPEHGDFEVTPGAHYILKSGCPECAEKQAINIVLEAKHDNTGAIQTFPGIVLSEPSYVNLFKSLTE